MKERVEALERANRHLRIAVVILFVLCVARLIVPASAQSVPDVIRAGKFEVVRNGRVMGYLGTNSEGGSLDIRNNSEQVVAFLDAIKSGGKLQIGNGSDNSVAILGSSNDKSGYLQLGNGDGKALVELLSNNGGVMNLRRPGGTDGIWMRGGGNTVEPRIEMLAGCIVVGPPGYLKFSSC